jgi:hypothetical protein
MGGFMKTNRFGLCRGVQGTLVLALLLALLCGGTPARTAGAQAPATQTPAGQADAAQAGAVQTARVPARVTQTVDEGNLVTLHGNVHRLALPEFDRGAVADSQPANRMVLLLQRSREQETALRQLLDEQQSKGSKDYHVWLTPDQFGKQFGPADTDVQAVTDWLAGQGFQIGHVAAGGMFVEFTGTVGQVRHAFHAEIHRFVVHGEEHFANVSDPQIPAALAPLVAGVVSLHNFPRRSHVHRGGVFERSKDSGNVRPLFTFTGCGNSNNQPCYALGPTDFATIYNVPSTINGKPAGQGQTIAIVSDSNINLADVTAFRQFFGLTANNPTVILNGPDPGLQDPNSASGDETEADLDVEWAGAIAPSATVDLVITEPPTTAGAAGVDLSALYIVENNLAPVMSESFDDCETSSSSSNQFYSTLWEQAAAQGITVMVSSGDNGSATCDGATATPETAAKSGLTVSGIASTQFNVAVGGTDFDDATNPTTYWNATSAPTTLASAKSYIPETTWNDSCASTAAANSLATCSTVNSNGNDIVAGGGGPSSGTAKPPWQIGTGVPADGKRDLPDVSLFASSGTKTNNFYVVCEADNVTTASNSCTTSGNAEFLAVGGTSASAPTFAAIIALVNQQTGQRQGNANYILYKLAAQAGASCNSSTLTPTQLTSNTCVFYDTTKGNNSVACVGGSTNCSNASTAVNQFGVLVDPSNTNTPAWITTPGYDRATGLGSVNVGNLAAKWTSVTFTASTTAITNSPSSPISHSGTASFTVKVTGTGAPTGDVSLIAGPAGTEQQVVTIGPFALSSGMATITTDLLPGGTNYPVTAHYAGDGTFGGSDSAAVNVTVSAETSKTALALIGSSGTQTSVTYGSPYVLRVDVTNASGTSCSASVPPTIPCPTGTVTFTDGTGPLNDFNGTNSATLNNEGFLEDQPVQLSVGSHSLVATYAGDNSYSGSPSAADAVTVTQAPTTIVLTPSASTVPIGQNVTLTATIGTQSSGVGPTGTVTFASGGTTLGTAPVAPSNASGLNTLSPTLASGTATLTTSFTTAGAKSITATYGGDTTYTASPKSTAVAVSVTAGSQATTTTVTGSATSIASGGSVTLTAKVTGSTNGGAGATGSVQFMNGTAALGTAATCTPTAGTSTTPGSCTATLTTALSILAPPSGSPKPRTPNVPLGPMGIVVSLLFAAFLLCLRQLPTTKRLGYAFAGALLFACVVAGMAGCGGGSSGSSGSTATHTDSITAVYNGDGNYAGSTSTAVTISIH